jgi:hypothetical protein
MTLNTATAIAPTLTRESRFVKAARTETPMLGKGMIAGTLVETDHGWKPVETLRTGDTLYTMDGGLRPVRDVHHSRLGYGGETPRKSMDLMHIPGGVLETCQSMMALPQQHVMLDLPEAEDLLDTPSVLVPLGALEGYRGISRLTATPRTGVVTLKFDDEEIVFANTGVMFHCASVTGQTDPLVTSEFFQTLLFETTRAMLGLDPLSRTNRSSARVLAFG